MKSRSLDRKLRKSLDQKRPMRFRLSCFDPEASEGYQEYDGIVAHLGDDFAVLNEFVDFEFDRITVLPSRLITACRDDRYDRSTHEILEHNRQIRRARIPAWMSRCRSMSDVIDGLMRRDIWPGIQTVSSDQFLSAFYLGPILERDADSLSLYCYDAAGKWEKPYDIPILQICEIRVGDSYSRHFNRFMKSQRPMPAIRNSASPPRRRRV